MSDDIKRACADMILADAIEDMADEEKISISEARDAILNSGAYEDLYNFDSLLWMEGPDYFRDYYKKVKVAEGKDTFRFEGE